MTTVEEIDRQLRIGLFSLADSAYKPPTHRRPSLYCHPASLCLPLYKKQYRRGRLAVIYFGMKPLILGTHFKKMKVSGIYDKIVTNATRERSLTSRVGAHSPPNRQQ